MQQKPFQTFIDLVALDQTIASLEKKVTAEDNALNVVDLAQHDALAAHKALEQDAREAKKRVDATELEMQQLDLQEKRKKAQLEDISNVKEFNSVKAELAAIHAAQKETEDAVIEAWNKLDAVNKAVDTSSRALGAILAEHTATGKEHQKAKEELLAQIEEYKKQRPEKEKHVPEEWLEKYRMMRARVKNPVVPLDDDQCSACFGEVNRQDVLSINRGGLVQCKGCYRLLYAPRNVDNELSNE